MRRSRCVGSALAADVHDKIARCPVGRHVGELEPCLDLDAPRAQVARAPPVAGRCPGTVPSEPRQAELGQRRFDVEVEAIGQHHDEPVIPVRPIEERRETRREGSHLGREGDHLLGRGFHQAQGFGEVALAASLAVPPFVAERFPCGVREALEDRRRNVVEGECTLVVDAHDSRHDPSVEGLSRLVSSQSMERERARYLVSPEALERLASFDGLPPDPLTLQRTLRKELPPPAAAAIGEQLVLRERARKRFGVAFARWLWTAETLEMAAYPPAAARRARRIAEVADAVIDGTLGAGVDLAACADAGLRAIGFERDGARALLAAHNLARRAVVLQADVLRPPADFSGSALLLDPSRRGASGRSFEPSRFEPPWGACLSLARTARTAVVKAPPGIDRRLLPADAEAEWVQAGRSLREAALWLGEGAVCGLRRAVILDAGAELDSMAPAADWRPGPLADVLYDPEPAVTRAGLVAQLAALVRGWPIERDTAYLSGPAFEPSPFARAFAVVDVLEFSVERLRQHLRRRGWRLGEILRRHFPLAPEELRRLCGSSEGEPVVAVCTTVNGRRTVILARPLPSAATPPARQ